MKTGRQEKEQTLRGKLTAWYRAEMKKTAYMTNRERAAYVIHYYWIWILGISCALIFLVYVLYRLLFVNTGYWFYAIYANTMEDGGYKSALWYDFTEYAGFDPKEKQIEMNAASWFDPSVRGGTMNSYFQAFVAVTEAGDLDVLTMGKEGIIKIGESGRLADLSTPEYSVFREKYGDRFIYCTPIDEEYSTEPVPVAIDVSDSLLVTKYHLYDGDCFLGIGEYTKRAEAVETFLEFILGDGDSGPAGTG